MSSVTNVVIAGLGGQGVLTASDILAHAAFSVGAQVKKSEVHGMSQRGGSVRSDVRFGPVVLSPMIPCGEADVLLALDETQVDFNRPLLRCNGAVVAPSALGNVELPGKRTLNIAMLGVLSVFCAKTIPEQIWIDVIEKTFPLAASVNMAAFGLGRQAAGNVAMEGS